MRRLASDGLEAWAQVLERGYEELVAKDEAWRIHYVAQQLGHSSVKVTEDYYLHLTAGDRRHKVGAYAAAIAAKRNRSTTGVGPELSQEGSRSLSRNPA